MKHSDKISAFLFLGSEEKRQVQTAILLLLTVGVKAKSKGSAYLNCTTQEQQQKPLHLLHAFAYEM